MSLVEDLRSATITADLTDDQLAELIDAGTEVHFAAGEELFAEGRPADVFWILLDGTIELTRRVANHTIVVATMSTRGQWAGGLTAWGDDEGVYRASGRSVTGGRCFTVPSDALGVLVGRWSPFARHLIAGIYQTVRGIDATARERESLVALGTLAARLAHEINNPAAAAMRAVEGLRNASGYMLDALVGLAERGIVAEQFLELVRLEEELRSRVVVDLGPVERADREELVGTWLEDHDVAIAWQVAPLLASLRVERGWLEEVEAAAGPDALAAAVGWMTSAVGILGIVDELSEATGRIAHLVDDVKTYSAMDRADRVRVDVRRGIESTLAMFAGELEGIEVTRAYDEVPEVEGYAAELNQVWTNLIDNAIDAMDGRGRLHIGITREGDAVVVDVTDSGVGIDPAELRHVFDPFFTTKDVGKGTGLGLDISRRIVERHGGEIGFDSRPGSTTARVRIPVAPS